jgi:hypothetical protein
VKLYITGPMTGIADYNVPAFREAAKVLLDADYDVADPSEQLDDTGTMTWADYMRADITLVLGCDGIATLPGWHNSRGAWLEVTIARELGLPIRTVEQWLTHQYCECVECLTSDLHVKRATS